MGLKSAWNNQQARADKLQAEAKAKKAETKEHKLKLKTDENYRTGHVLNKYGLDIDNYSNDDIKRKNSENIQRITTDLGANGLFKTGMALSFAKAEEQAKVGYLSALVEQNWIIIRQNEVMLRNLEKLNETHLR